MSAQRFRRAPRFVEAWCSILGGEPLRVMLPEDVHAELAGTAVNYSCAKCFASVFADQILSSLPDDACEPGEGRRLVDGKYLVTVRFGGRGTRGETQVRWVRLGAYLAACTPERRAQVEAAQAAGRICIDAEYRRRVAIASFCVPFFETWAKRWADDLSAPGEELSRDLNELMTEYIGLFGRTRGEGGAW